MFSSTKLTHVLRKGNNPPWFNKAKAKYGFIEGKRVTARAGKSEIQFPEDLMPMSHTVLVSYKVTARDHDGHIL